MTAAPKSMSAAEQMGMHVAAGPFGQALVAAAEADPNIFGVTGDLEKYTDMQAFAARFPGRFVNAGMAEQNLVALSAGLAQAGYTVVATGFAAFLTRRAQDFTIMQVALSRANVKLIGAVPGISAGFGPSHTSIDDLAMMRAVPNMVVIDPSDTAELGAAMTAALAHQGPVYLRQPFATHSGPGFALPGPFRIGEAQLLRDGGDAGFIASGFMVAEALAAADRLKAEGVDVAVLKISTLKPFDTGAVAALAKRVKRLVTAENHSILNGLYSAVSETVAWHGIGATIRPIGVKDEFPGFGSRDFVAARLGLTQDAIIAALREQLQ